MTALWFADRGAGELFVLLHPGGADARAFEPLMAELDGGYRFLTPDQHGHGRTPDREGEWSFADMAADTAALLEELGAGPAHVLGWSDGGVLGLYLAHTRPDLVRSLVVGGAPFHLDGWREGVLDGGAPGGVPEGYAELSPDGPEHWRVVAAKSDRLHEREPALMEDDVRALTMPVLILQGDDDEVRFEHTVRMYEALPDGELAIVPRASHGLIVEKPALLARLIRDFHDPGKTDGLVPIRRARSTGERP